LPIGDNGERARKIRVQTSSEFVRSRPRRWRGKELKKAPLKKNGKEKKKETERVKTKRPQVEGKKKTKARRAYGRRIGGKGKSRRQNKKV